LKKPFAMYPRFSPKGRTVDKIDSSKYNSHPRATNKAVGAAGKKAAPAKKSAPAKTESKAKPQKKLGFQKPASTPKPQKKFGKSAR
jgi:hypothetical protein